MLSFFRYIACSLFTVALVMSAQITFAQNAQRTSDFDIRQTLAQGKSKESKASNERAKKFFDSCTNELPYGFTPNAREDFCTCASVAVQRFLTNGELDLLAEKPELQNDAYKIAVIKYVEGVVVACLDEPIRNMAYVSCLESRSHDFRIKNFPAYCSCTGDVTGSLLVSRGAQDMINHFMKFGHRTYPDPVESFTRSPAYGQYVKHGMERCMQPAFMRLR